MSSTLIIAEAGVNHNGSEALAFQLVDKAVAAGVDVVKFQTFKSELLVTEQAKQADYQVKNTQQKESQLSMLKKLELPFQSHLAIRDYCREKGIEYLSTAFDEVSLDFLVNDMKLTKLKLPSGELTNTPFVLAHAKTGCDLIVSTGMATIEEIHFALATIAYGLLNQDVSACPKNDEFILAYRSQEGQAILKEKVSLLHCTTEYPAPFDEVNLNAMALMEQEFGLPIGYSDHTAGIAVSLASVAKGAVIIEKHFTLDQEMEGPDHKASIEPDELLAMVQGVRQIESALGKAIKAPSESEKRNMEVARKSIVASATIKQGDVFSEQNLAVKRPGNGISPTKYYLILGKVAEKDFFEGELITMANHLG